MEQRYATSDEGRDVLASVDALRALIQQTGALADADLVAAVGTVEALGRMVDAARVRLAGEVDVRSARDSEDRLSAKFGCRNGVELLERTTRVSAKTINARIRLDKRTRPRMSLTGDELPARFPHVGQALRDGTLGVDATHEITGSLARVEDRADPQQWDAAEATTVAYATGALEEQAGMIPPTFAEVEMHARTWAAYLDQDGPEPDAERATRNRGLTLGTPRDGLVPLRGSLLPEVAAGLQRLLDAHLNPAVRFTPTLDPEDRDETEAWSQDEAVHDPRTNTQKRHDVLAVIIQAAAKATETPTLGGAAPTLVVTVAEDDLHDPTAAARIDDTRVPVSTAHRIACTGAVQKIIHDRTGRIIRLGTPERVFNAHQRRAITARDGGCVIPGCTIPAAWCEIHHVDEHANGGPTHTDNGVLVCWWHHHNLDRSGWDIRMRAGIPVIKAPPWIDRRGTYRPAPNALIRRRPRARPPSG
ncbi:HNH endonuclease signature motif containing protein [Microbacterium album]|nr:HNH endonuclease signature motif containing protein [Microbacterium album]